MFLVNDVQDIGNDFTGYYDTNDQALYLKSYNLMFYSPAVVLYNTNIVSLCCLSPHMTSHDFKEAHITLLINLTALNVNLHCLDLHKNSFHCRRANVPLIAE